MISSDRIIFIIMFMFAVNCGFLGDESGLNFANYLVLIIYHIRGSFKKFCYTLSIRKLALFIDF